MKGYSAFPDSARLVHAFHAFNVGVSARVWFAHVRSKANVADAPSRGDMSYARRVLQATVVTVSFPHLDLWLTPAGPWMEAALQCERPRVRRVRRRHA